MMTDQSLFFSPAGSRPLAPSGSLLAASASSNQASRTGFKAIMLLWDSVSDSNLQSVAGIVHVIECWGHWPTDSALRESSNSRKFEIGQSFTNVCLGHSKLYPPLLEPLGEGFYVQIFRYYGL